MTDLQAVFFDFDGLILDTENACYAAWYSVFKNHGFEYRLEEFQRIVGTDGTPRTLLEDMIGYALDWNKIDPGRREHEDALGRSLEIKPGVMELIEDARSRGWKCAVVSNSPHHWVSGHLERRGALGHFDGFVCRDDALRAKPAPDLYLEALRRFEVRGEQTVAFEDSYNGSLAAKRAGVWCVAVPNEVTRAMDFSHADLVSERLLDVELNSLVQRFISQ